LTKTTKTLLIFVCIALLFGLLLSFLFFNAYAQQQGGGATGGSATSGSTVGGPANCFGTCIFNGPSSTGGSATGGNAVGAADGGGSSGGSNSSSQSGPSQIPNNPLVHTTISTKNHFLKKWGSIGTGNGQFNRPIGIAIDSSNENVYVLDSGNNRIQKFDSDGNSLTSWPINGTSGISSSSNRVNNLPGIAVDYSGNVYQSASSSNKILKYTTDGTFINSWGSNGKDSGQFSSPTGLAVYQSGNYVYVIDHNNFRIQKFDSDGKFISTWGSQGTADGQFKNPTAIAIDSVGNVYVGDSGNFNIQKFDTDGKLITKWSTKSSESGQSSGSNPTGIAVDTKSGNLYITDATNNRVQVLNQPLS